MKILEANMLDKAYVFLRPVLRHHVIRVFCFVAGFFSFSPSGNTFDFSANGTDAPVDIEAENGIVCEKQTNRCIANGNARVIHKNSVLQADRVVAVFEQNPEMGDAQQLIQVEAIGNVHIFSTQKNQKGFAEHAVYDIRSGEAVFTGGNLRLEVDDTVITAKDKMQYFEKQNEARAFGHAIVRRGDRMVQANQIRAFMKPGKDGALVLEKSEAYGDVRVTVPGKIAIGDHGKYIQNTDTVTLDGKVQISCTGAKNDAELKGSFGEVNLKTGQCRLLPSDPEDKKAPRQKVKVLLIPH